MNHLKKGSMSFSSKNSVPLELVCFYYFLIQLEIIYLINKNTNVLKKNYKFAFLAKVFSYYFLKNTFTLRK